MATTIYLTEEGLKNLQNELVHLKEVKRVEIAEKLKEAISFGDLSENAEYEEARNEQAQVELRITEVEEQLKNVEIIKEDPTSKNKVNIGSEFVLSDSNGDKETYKIVGTTESDILSDLAKISNESPVGEAVLGKKKGDSVTVKSLGGSQVYKIVEIK